MSDTGEIIVNDVVIDKTKADVILKWLILAEKRNVKNKEKSDQQMVSAIQKKIEEVVPCY